MNEKRMTNNLTVVLLASISCFLWGSAPACIKLGYQLFQIDVSSTMDILLFAGLRFTLAGLLVVLGYSLIKRKLIVPKKEAVSPILILAVFQTMLQYLLFYIGTANASGVKVSILSGMNTCFGVIIACLIFRQEKLTRNKLLGCIAGFAGIVVINLNGTTDAALFDMTLIGEGFVLLAAVSGSVAAVFIRRFSQKNDSVMLSGYQFVVGGIVLILVALIGGGKLPVVTASGLLLLLYLGFLSAVAYSLWSLLLQYNPVSKVLVYHPLMPIFGVVLSALILSEGGIFSWNTLVSLILVCFGIWLINFTKVNKK